MVDSEAQVCNMEAAQTPPQNDAVNHPPHYNHGGMETIDYIETLGIGFEFCAGNAIKYLSRAGYKDDILQDLRKALWYTERAFRCTYTQVASYLLERVQVCIKDYIEHGKETSLLKAEDLVGSIGCNELPDTPLTDLLGSAVRCWKWGI